MPWQEIDMEGWKRAAHCAAFRNCANPQYCVSFELDVTDFRRMVRQEGYSFTLAFIYAVARAANGIEAFRYRFMDGKVVLYDEIGASFTYLDRETELFKVVNVEMQESMEAFVALAAKRAREQEAYFTGVPGNEVFIFSAFPWVSYTHISHTDSGRRDNAIPLFDWGKYFVRAERLIMPFSVQVHHSFVDGIHIGKLAERLQNDLCQPARFQTRK